MLTPEEKVLLYEAIGYSETAVDPTLPKTVRYFLALYLFNVSCACCNSFRNFVLLFFFVTFGVYK